MNGRVLVVDDDAAMRDLLGDGLSERGFTTTCRGSAREAMADLETDEHDVVVTDVRMRGMDGVALCSWVVSERPNIPVVVITAFGSMDTAVAALRAGAYDFITKPLDLDVLALTIQRAVQHRSLREEVQRLRDDVRVAKGFDEIVGQSEPMRKLFALLERVAESDASVLITGETGTGKELVARAIHRRSARKDGPFVAIDCAAMPEQLLESELFGHVKGAFTDARTARTGLLVNAQGGTVFLDEVGDMPLGLQPKLLRTLQERVVRPVGGGREVSFDSRLVAATHHDLDADVEAGQFRRDLFFRINVLHVELPALRHRGNDVLLLAQHFVNSRAARAGKKVMGISAPAAERLLDYCWPGNVRELQNCIERAVALTASDQIRVEDLSEKIRSYRRARPNPTAPGSLEMLPLEEVERRHVLGVLEACAGNKAQAARVLGMDRRTLYRKLGEYGT